MIAILKDLNTNMKEVGYNMRKMYKTLSSIDETKKLELEEKRRHNAEIEIACKEKLNLKRRILEMEIAYINDH